MNNNLTDITIVLDKSGSMSVVRDDTIGGLNSFIEEQKRQPGECNLTIWDFASAYSARKLLSTTSLAAVIPLTREQYVPGGNTALHDAVSIAIDDTGARLSAMPENQRPDKVLFVILTDGEENNSKVANAQTVKNKKEQQEKVYNWQFIYLGAAHDSFAQGSIMGFTPEYVDHRKEYTNGGILLACSNLSNSASSYRGGGKATINTTKVTQ